MKNTFDPDSDIPALTGQVHIVTGGSAGIGFGVVAHLLQHKPEKIYLLSNKEEHAQEAIDGLKEWGDIDTIEWIQCNLADLQQTNDVAHKLKGHLNRLDSLVANAGLGVGKYWETGDGLDGHYQVNHLAQKILIMTLLPTLLATSRKDPNSSPRIVLMSSDLHRAAPTGASFKTKDEINQDIGPMLLYNRSKLAQVLFTRRLQSDLENGTYGPGKIYVNATHPGGVATDQQTQAIEAYGTLGKIGVKAVKPLLTDPVAKGCRSGLFAATSPDIVESNITGSYIVPDCKVTDPSKQASDAAPADQLWSLDEQLLRERFGGRSPYEGIT